MTDERLAGDWLRLRDLPLDPLERRLAVLQELERHRKAGDLVRRSKLWASEAELERGYRRGEE